MTAKRTTSNNSALSRAMSLLEATLAAERPVSAAELGNLLGFPKPTAHRVALQLEREGWLRRDIATKLFVPGARLCAMATAVLTNSSVHAPARAILRALSEELEETCNLVTFEADEVVYFDRVESSWPVGVRFARGSRLPTHCTASGKLYLSRLAPRQRAALLGAGPLKRHTEKTIVDPEVLEAQLKAIRKSGIGTDDEELISGMVAVAVPVRDARGRMFAALAVHTTTLRRTLPQLLESTPALLRGADALSKALASGGGA